MIVIDTSVLVDAILDRTMAEALAKLLKSEKLAAPEHIFAEVLNVLRRMERNGDISSIFAERVLAMLQEMPISTYALRPLLNEAWIIRHNITPYDALFVVLAGELDCALLTHDEKLANAARDHIETRRLTPAP